MTFLTTFYKMDTEEAPRYCYMSKIENEGHRHLQTDWEASCNSYQGSAPSIDRIIRFLFLFHVFTKENISQYI